MSEDATQNTYKPVELPEGYVPKMPKLSDYKPDEGKRYPAAYNEAYRYWVKWRSIQIASLSGGNVARSVEGRK